MTANSERKPHETLWDQKRAGMHRIIEKCGDQPSIWRSQNQYGND
jgi:hypothetical protein